LYLDTNPFLFLWKMMMNEKYWHSETKRCYVTLKKTFVCSCT
jgi:hypothetical protein